MAENTDTGTVSLRDHFDSKIDSLEEKMEVNFELDRKAVAQYSKTNDEWKELHNGLQRKMEEDRGKYVTKEDLNRQTKLIVSVVFVLIALYEFIIRTLIK